ncbi:hypothetical protein [Stenotrophomonas pavanii]|uniref:hypothetical protein n=1 Tax=Stenotrophomonas pavanii TaxID=487698 RepID=UPI0039C6D6C0
MSNDKITAAAREPYDAMGPIDTPNPPAARATLADVQPGGRVRLGDQALSTSEGARRYVADFFATEMRRHDFGDYILTELAADFACALAQHLSAQASPGGQDALTALVAKWRAAAAEHELISLEEDSVGLTKAAMRNDARHHVLEAVADDLEAVLSARQPVASNQVVEDIEQLPFDTSAQPSANSGALAVDGARQPVGEPVAVRVTPEMRAAFRKAYREGGFWHDRLDTALDAMMRAAPPAQAVDLPYSLDADPAGIRARVCDVITGTLMVGAQGHTPPPAGHWAEPFWQAARADAAAQGVDLAAPIPSELAPVAAALKRFDECAEDCASEGCDIGRAWFDALTTVGLLKRTQRSPAVWTMTAEGERLLALIDSHSEVSRG